MLEPSRDFVIAVLRVCASTAEYPMSVHPLGYAAQVARGLLASGAEGVVLGCTELELLVTAETESCRDIVFFRSAQLHMEAAAQVQVPIAHSQHLRFLTLTDALHTGPPSVARDGRVRVRAGTGTR
jgi:hypothetical protein